MNFHLIYAHPTPGSMNGRLKNASLETLLGLGHHVQISDLYGQQFRAVAGPADFTELLNPEYFDLQKEQVHALQQGTFVPEIQEEQQKLLWADALIFHFPFWWYSMPAIVKGYFDRVFSQGFAYGGGFKLEGKQVLTCLTTGAGPDWLNEEQPPGSLEKILHHLYYGTFDFCNMTTLPSFYVYQAKRLSEPERQAKLEEWSRYLKTLFS